MGIEIKYRHLDRIVWSSKMATTVAEAVREAVKAHEDLSGADLRSADLRSADLRSEDLSGADLSGADLRSADLSGADLSGADLSGADLSGADLRSADLRSADLSGADLRSADLRSADLSGADLRSADLSGADLRSADLTPIRDDLWAVLSSAPNEVAGLIAALKDGRVNGSTYTGECACLVGTIANVKGVGHCEMPALKPNASRPAERFFLAIQRDDTPETSQFSALAVEWAEEWLAGMRAAFGSRDEVQA